jgi:very-short-patch-repair endonuclease
MQDHFTRQRAREQRRVLTSAEQLLWQALRRDALGVRFRRQHPVPPFIADFACTEARLIVELDGSQHGDGRDVTRDAALAAAGWRVLRVWNNDVTGNLDGVLRTISGAVRERVFREL